MYNSAPTRLHYRGSMSKACEKCKEEFEITQGDEGFYSEMKVPAPTFCPDCRQQRRLAWRNEDTLHKRNCDATGRSILSVYLQSSIFPVYDNEYWYSDKWSGLNYGKDFDFDRPFFEQFEELMYKIPQLARSAVNNQNCDYVNQCGWCKNCYLIFEADHNENCMYSHNIYDSKSCIDNYHLHKSELCYECVNCQKSYNLKYSENCTNCADSFFLKNCIGCKNCFGCINLRNKQYYFLNEKLSKQDYEAKINEIDISKYEVVEQYRKRFAEFVKTFPHKDFEGRQNENSTGDYLSNTQRCYQCFNLDNSQDCKYVFDSRHVKNVHDMTVFGSLEGAESCYENHEIGGGVREVFFSDQVWMSCYNIYYSKLCVQNCHHLFGCVGLKHQEYCILNKKYSPEEYENLKNRIIDHMKKTGEWGQFFPAPMSPFGYNETLANDYYPLSKDEAIAQGFNWSEISATKAQSSEDNQICKACNKEFKFIENELQYYDRNKIPQPHHCPKCRHKYRFKIRNPRKLFRSQCSKCSLEIHTSHDPAKGLQVYCEKCYLDCTK